MEVTINKINDNVEVVVSGKIDTNTSGQLEDQVKDYLNCQTLFLDLKDVDYVSSAGLRVILLFYKSLKSANSKFVIRHVQDDVMDIFDMTGFSTFLTFED